MIARYVVAGWHVVVRWLVSVGRHVVAGRHVDDNAAAASVLADADDGHDKNTVPEVIRVCGLERLETGIWVPYSTVLDSPLVSEIC